MNEQKQEIDISPQAVAPIAQAGLNLLNLPTTLTPGNLRAQIGMLEVYLSGLAGGQIVLAPAPEAEVQSDAKKPDSDTPGKTDGRPQTDDSGSGSESPSKT